MKKRMLSIALVVAMIAIIAAGSLAYFTDTDEAKNTFAVGGVAIALHEANNADDPAIDDDYHAWLKDQVLMPGDDNTNNIAKRVYVENNGKSDAYVRVHIAIPSVLDDGADTFDASSNLLHFNNLNGGPGLWNWSNTLGACTEGKGYPVKDESAWNYYEINVDGIDYNVYVVTYEKALAPKTFTEDAMYQVYLYNDVTNEDIAKADATLKGDWNILVFAEAGQTDGFADAFDALNTQFGVPSAETSPWAKLA